MARLTDTVPTDWAYLSEGGATIVFSYVGTPNPTFDGTVLRLRKRRHDSSASTHTISIPGSAPSTVQNHHNPPPPPVRHEDPTIAFQRECIARLIPPAHLPRLEALDSDRTLLRPWLEMLASQCVLHRPEERRRLDAIDLSTPAPVLATDLVGGQGIAVEIKVPRLIFAWVHCSDPRSRNGASCRPRRTCEATRWTSRASTRHGRADTACTLILRRGKG
jgi:inositol-pentakisphosphate 2-kinase